MTNREYMINLLLDGLKSRLNRVSIDDDEVIKRLHETEKPFMPLVQTPIYNNENIWFTADKTEKLYMLFTLYQKERNFQKQ